MTSPAHSPWRLFASLVRPHRRSVSAYGAALAASTAIPIIAALLLARFIDFAVRRAPLRDLVLTAVAYVVLGVVSSSISVLVTWRTTALAWDITDTLRRDLAHYVLHADLAFHRDHTKGEIVSRTDDDVTAMANFLAQFVARGIAVVAMTVASVCTLSFLHPQLGIVLGICMALVLGLTWGQRNGSVTPAVADRDARGVLSGLIEERVDAAEEIASLGARDHSIRAFARIAQSVVLTRKTLTARQMRSYGIVRLSVTATELTMLLFGAQSFVRHEISLGTVFLGVRFAAATRAPLEPLMWRLLEFAGATGSATRVLSLISQRPTHPERVAKLPDGPLDIELRDLTVVYDETEGAAIDDITLTVRGGRSLGIVGRSGSGKTTLGRVVLRLLAPTSGRVCVGGVPIGTIVEDDFRTRVVGVPQDVQLFPGSVRENVAMFDDQISDEAVAKALIDVGLKGWLARQPDGLQSMLRSRSTVAAGHGGSNGVSNGVTAGMSAGEAQLLSLARTLVRSPGVVVLDEATSRVDRVTEALLKDAVRTLLRDRTSIVIAHRLDTLDVCDDIAVLDGGKVVEYGQREQLAADPESQFGRLLRIGGAHDGAMTVDDAFGEAAP